MTRAQQADARRRGAPRRPWLVLVTAGLLLAPVPLLSLAQASAPSPTAVVLPEVSRAACGPDDRPEPPAQLQGQVTAAERTQGFGGRSCNLQRVGVFPGPGASYVGAVHDDCAYYSTAGQGVVVVDLSDPSAPRETARLTSPAMLQSWESLKVNAARELLAATSYGEDALDVYTVADCAQPRLLASIRIPGAQGHEGEWAPDGRTYYVTNRQNYGVADFGFVPVDVSDPRAPRVLPRWDTPGLGRAHGLSLSADGTRMYLAVPHGVLDPGGSPGSGFLTLDVTDIQRRAQAPQVRVLSAPRWRDGGEAQMTIPVEVRGVPHVIATDEWGTFSSDFGRLGCADAVNGGAAYGYPRVFDMSDETAPRQVSTIRLQTQIPTNCTHVVNDTAHLFSYSTHYCAVDRPLDPQLLGCATFESGLRVFDIRDVARPREVAYYNPPARPGTASEKAGLGYTDVDWASSPPVFRLDRGEVWVQFQDNGVEVLRLSPDVLAQPSAASTPPPGTSEQFTDGPNSYRVYTPVGYTPGEQLPLYVMVHGCNTSAAEQEGANLINALADRERFVVLYPDHDQPTSTSVGTHPGRCWRFYTETDKHRDAGDPATIARQTEAVAAGWGVDRSRIYLVGMSSGGMMTSNTAAAYPDVYAAIAVVAGCAYGAGPTCITGAATDTEGQARAAHAEQGPRARVVPVLAVQGDRDLVVSPANNPLVVQQWSKTGNLALSGRTEEPMALTSATSATREPADRYRYLEETYRDPGCRLIAKRVFIEGMGHDWPGGTADPAFAAFTDPRAPSGAVLTWEFLSRYRLVAGQTVFDAARSVPGATEAGIAATPTVCAAADVPARNAPQQVAAPGASRGVAARRTLPATGAGVAPAALGLALLATAGVAWRRRADVQR